MSHPMIKPKYTLIAPWDKIEPMDVTYPIPEECPDGLNCFHSCINLGVVDTTDTQLLINTMQHILTFSHLCPETYDVCPYKNHDEHKYYKHPCWDQPCSHRNKNHFNKYYHFCKNGDKCKITSRDHKNKYVHLAKDQPTFSPHHIRLQEPVIPTQKYCDRCQRPQGRCEHLFELTCEHNCNHLLCESCFPDVGSICFTCDSLIIDYKDLITGKTFWDYINEFHDTIIPPEEDNINPEVTVEPSTQTCPICQSDCTDPYMSPCVHTFCHDCIMTWTTDNIGGRESQEKPCPICRTDFSYEDLIPLN